MIKINQYTNEDLVSKFQGGDEDALNTLWLQNEKLTHKFINYYVKNSDFEKDEVLSFMHFAFMYAVRSFKEELGYKFNTYYGKAVKNNFRNEFKYKRQRKFTYYKTISIDQSVTESDNCSLLDIIGGKNDDLTKAETDNILLQKAIDYAKSRIKKEYHDHIIKYCFEDEHLSVQEIVSAIEQETGKKKTKQIVYKTIDDFKNHIKDYILHETNRKIVEVNKKTKVKTELIPV